MSPKLKFYLHMGMGRTGSSALQVAFVRNKDSLAAANTVYPASRALIEAAESDRLMSGNGGVIRRLLIRDASDQKGAWTALERRIADAGSHHVLFSSEVLSSKARPNNLERLVGFLDRLDRSLHPILYVRNIAGHALSSYGLRIMRSGTKDTFSEYCAEKYRPNYRTTLEKLLGVAAESVSVVHYDSVRENIFAHFLHEILAAPSSTTIDDPVVRGVNRSPSGGELDILRRINAANGTNSGSRLLSDSLLGEFPQVHAEKSIPRDVVSVLHDRFGDEVEWVNGRFFGDSRLTVGSPELAITDEVADLMNLEPMQRVLLGLVAAGTTRAAK